MPASQELVLPQPDSPAPIQGHERRSDGMEILQHGSRTIAHDVEDLYPIEQIGLPATYGDATLRVVGELAIPDQPEADDDRHLALIQVQHADGSLRYGLQGLAIDTDGRAVAARTSMVPVDIEGQSRTLGRNGDAGDATIAGGSYVKASRLWGHDEQYSSAVSRQHVTVRATREGLVIRDTSTNGTMLAAGESQSVDFYHPEDDYVSIHTIKAEEKARLMNVAENGVFSGRKIITRDTTMGGTHPEATVDIRSWVGGGEAIVVDSQDEEGTLPGYVKLQGRFDQKLRNLNRWSRGNPGEKAVLKAIYESVLETIDYDLEYADKTAEELTAGSRSKKINLSVYLEDGKGVCRHMALAAAWLGGEAAEAGLLSGRLTAEVNQRNSDNSAHEWARYTAPDGTVYIIDPAQHYFGLLKDTLRGPKRWHYFREGEKRDEENRLRQLAGKIITHMS